MPLLEKKCALGLAVSFAFLFAPATAQPAPNHPATNQIYVLEQQGTVEVLNVGTIWRLAEPNQLLRPLDRVRTGNNSRVALRWSDQSIVPFGASTELEILPPRAERDQPGLHLLHGVLSFFHRDQPGRIQIITRGAVAGVEGTEFALAVDDAERTTLSVIDGKVKLSNPQSALLLTNGQQAIVEPGQPPVATAGFIANNILQWCFYYPAVLDPAELQLTTEEETALRESLAAYRSCNLLSALAKFSAAQPPSTDAVHVYHAALLLAVGQAGPAETTLATLSAAAADSRPQQLAAALRQLIAAVKRQPAPTAVTPQLATELLAASYHEQSRAIRETSLINALNFARKAAERAPQSSFAWARVAELEFCFGCTDEALAALDQSLALAPHNAPALALKGFLLAAQNQTGEALAYYDRALAADSALGNAWLGRGLCKIKRGDAAGGREDLLVAAALEPQRAELRSYLGKAYMHNGDDAHATKELALAKKLDPNDPTAWLYSALLNQRKNLINEAIHDLEKSKELNGNRSVYRSQLLLDQDQAVRSANLASVYRDAGMTDVSVREAGRAVSSDYANYSAHLFLAGSYRALLQPEQNNSRFETAVQSEYLLANLLAPASAGMTSPLLDQQRYYNPFERNRVGVISSTEYLSRGAWRQTGLQYGTFGNFSYGVEAEYFTTPGERQRVNDDLEKRTLTLKLKWQPTPEDTIYAEVGHYQAAGGDLCQYYEPTMASPDARFKEKQAPALSLGYHHEWSPGVHTLFMASRVEDDFAFSGWVPLIIPTRFANYTDDPRELVSVLGGLAMLSKYHNEQTLYSSELQQIWEQPAHTTIIGGRVQYGCIRAVNFEYHPSAVLFADNVLQDQRSSSKRFSVYGYHHWQIAEPLQLIGGLSYDWLAFPENLFALPISSNEETAGQLSPKAGFIWTPAPDTTVRFAYTRSLGGQNFDQSQRIEPTQVAGFLQSFRSIIGEPSVAPNGALRNETFGLSLEKRFSTGTYIGLTGELLNAKLRQTVGVFERLPDEPLYIPDTPGGLREHVNYQEKSLQLTINQLLGHEWALGAQYRLSHAKLEDDFPEVSQNDDHLYHNPTYPFAGYRNTEATLHNLNLFAIYNHSSGLFAKVGAQWFAQNNAGYSPAEPGDAFWQFDAFVGYRFWHRKAEVTLGVLNLADEDYKLNPLNAYNELPRERTLLVRFQLNF